MKLRLSQSKCGSTGRIDRSANLRNELFLDAFHFRRAGGSFIIKPAEMKQAVRNVQTQLVLERCPKGPRLAPRRFHAEHHLAVLECDDISRSRFGEETLMQLAHPPIRNQDDAHVAQRREHFSFAPGQVEAREQSAVGKVLERPQFDPHHSLAVAHDNLRRPRLLPFSGHVNGRDSAWKFRVIKRAPLLNVK